MQLGRLILVNWISRMNLEYFQGRNQVCSQRWARLENFPFPDFFPCRNFHFGTPQTNSSGFKKWKKKGSSAHFHTFPFHFKFSCSLFTISLLFLSISLFFPCLFPFLFFFPLPSLFLRSPFFPNFPPNFLRVGDSPTSSTPSYTTEYFLYDI